MGIVSKKKSFCQCLILLETKKVQRNSSKKGCNSVSTFEKMSEGSKTLNSGEAMSCPSMKSCKGHLHVNITKFKFELIVKGKKVRKQAEFLDCEVAKAKA